MSWEDNPFHIEWREGGTQGKIGILVLVSVPAGSTPGNEAVSLLYSIHKLVIMNFKSFYIFAELALHVVAC